ncbi:MAG TPA: cation:proton antiporter [Candidatus Bilamarchaeaceae archaeon]|nr:cation:proton antiporter [Candidatus Bilamarchaeaceae archaeon]
MVDPVIGTFALIGTIIVIGLISEELFRRTKIPSVIILIALGLVIGPLSNYADPKQLIDLAPLFAPIAFIMILFDGGLKMDLFNVLKSSPRALLLAVLTVVFSIVACAFIFNIVFGFDLLIGAVFGAIVGGSSSAIVMPIMENVSSNEKLRNLLSVESIGTDVLCIVITISLVAAYTTGVGDVFSIGGEIFSKFLVGAMFGAIAAIAWMKILHDMKEKSLDYMITLATLFLLYSVAESFNGNGAIAVLVYGLVISNGLELSTLFRIKKYPMVDEVSIKKTHNEISFFIRTFFFVYLGIIASITDFFIMTVGIGLTIILFLVRFVSSYISVYKTALARYHALVSSIAPRGLAAAVLAQLPFSSGIQEAKIFSELVLVVIVTSVVLTTVLVWVVSKVENSEKKRKEKKSNKSLKRKKRDEEDMKQFVKLNQ